MIKQHTGVSVLPRAREVLSVNSVGCGKSFNVGISREQLTATVYFFENQHPRRKHRGCCSHKVVALGFNTLCYDAERRGIKTSARIRYC